MKNREADRANRPEAAAREARRAAPDGKKRKPRPSVGQLEAEIERGKQKRRFRYALRSTVYILVTVAAAVILLATLFFPVLKIYGNSMSPTLDEGQIVVALKGSSFDTGDIIAFYYNNKILVKRVICGAGDWVNIYEDGSVLVNGSLLDESYLSEAADGTCDLELPYQVPEGQIFVMGDQRLSSIDSRSSIVGCVSQEQIVGRIVLCIWPLRDFGPVG